MSKTERKNKLNEFIKTIKECISDLEDTKDKESKLMAKIDELNALTEDYALGENLFDVDNMQSTIISSLIESTQFHEISEEISGFKVDLNEEIGELPEDAAEELDDLFDDWSNVTDLFELSDEDVIDDAIANLEKALQLIEDRIKEKKY